MSVKHFNQIATVTIDGHSLYLTMVLHPETNDSYVAADGSACVDGVCAWIDYVLSSAPLACNTPADECIAIAENGDAFLPVSAVPQHVWDTLTEAYIAHENYIDAPMHSHHRARLIYRLLDEAGVYGGAA